MRIKDHKRDKHLQIDKTNNWRINVYHLKIIDMFGEKESGINLDERGLIKLKTYIEKALNKI